MPTRADLANNPTPNTKEQVNGQVVTWPTKVPMQEVVCMARRPDKQSP